MADETKTEMMMVKTTQPRDAAVRAWAHSPAYKALVDEGLVEEAYLKQSLEDLDMLVANDDKVNKITNK